MNQEKPAFGRGIALILFASVSVAFVAGLSVGSEPVEGGTVTGENLLSVNNRIKDIEDSLENISLQTQELLKQLDSIRDGGVISRRPFLEPVPEPSLEENIGGESVSDLDPYSSSDHWISVLPREVSRMLVLRGMSPYRDTEVLPLIRMASESLLESEKEYLERARVELENLNNIDRSRLYDILRESRKMRDEKILDDLARGLDQIKK